MKQISNNIKRSAIEYNLRIELELLDRVLMHLNPTEEEELNKSLQDQKNKNIALDYYNAKPSILSNDILNSNISE